MVQKKSIQKFFKKPVSAIGILLVIGMIVAFVIISIKNSESKNQIQNVDATITAFNPANFVDK